MARTTIHDDTVMVLMQDTLTKGERHLCEADRRELVSEVRSAFQQTMRADMVAAVEMLCERKVIASMSANHLDPDMAAELFVLAPAPRIVG